MSKLVTIAGGGLAGLSLGIGLRQRGVPVTIWEAGRYPRHRVCGEFISGRGQSSLERLGLLRLTQGAGARKAESAAFFSGIRGVPALPLPQPALCLSRYVLDALLAQEFERLGGELCSGKRWQGRFGSGIVRASGRRVGTTPDGWRLFGLKVHAQGVEMLADLELHFVPQGYVGLCCLGGGQVNVCGLFRSKTPEPALANHWGDWLKGPADSALRLRLQSAKLEESSFCSVAGFSLQPQSAEVLDECCVGDALTMIPPLTGNGMSMAFESAELALEPLVKFSLGKLSWDEAQHQIARACDGEFTRRLLWANWLQHCLFQPPTRAALLFFAAHSPRFWSALFGRTR